MRQLLTIVLVLLAAFGACSKSDSSLSTAGTNNSGSTLSSEEIEYYMHLQAMDFVPDSVVQERLISTCNSTNMAKSINVKSGSQYIPSSVDWSNKMPPVFGQIGGSCVSSSVVYYTKSYQEGIEMQWDLTESSHQFSPLWAYNQCGCSITGILDLLTYKGADTMDQFAHTSENFENNTQPDTASFQRAAQYKSCQWYVLKNDIDLIKTYLANGQVLPFATTLHKSFDLNTTNEIYDITSVDDVSDAPGHHMLCLVGYDDNKQAFKFVNSWGSGWGTYKDAEDPSQGCGYGWIAYNLFKNPHAVTENFGLQVFLLIDSANSAQTSSIAYRIISKESEMAITAVGDFMDQNNNIVQNTFAGSLNQQWFFDKYSDGYLRMLNANHFRNANVSGGNYNPGGSMTMWGFTSDDNEKWNITVMDGYYQIASKLSDVYMNLAGGSHDENAQICQWTWQGGASNELWRIEPVGNFRIKSPCNGRYMMPLDGASYWGTPAVTTTYSSNDTSQHWIAVHAGDGYYQIINRQNGLALAIKDSSTSFAASIVLAASDSTQSSQLWRLEMVDGGSYFKIYSKLTGLYMNVDHGYVADNAQVLQWPWQGGSTNEEWILEGTE